MPALSPGEETGVPNELRIELKTRDTSSKNATPSTIVNEKKRALSCAITPCPDLAFTSQMRLIEVCS